MASLIRIKARNWRPPSPLTRRWRSGWLSTAPRPTRSGTSSARPSTYPFPSAFGLPLPTRKMWCGFGQSRAPSRIRYGGACSSGLLGGRRVRWAVPALPNRFGGSGSGDARRRSLGLDRRAFPGDPGAVQVGLTFRSKDGAFCRTFKCSARRQRGPRLPRWGGLAGAYASADCG